MSVKNSKSKSILRIRFSVGEFREMWKRRWFAGQQEGRCELGLKGVMLEFSDASNRNLPWLAETKRGESMGRRLGAHRIVRRRKQPDLENGR